MNSSDASGARFDIRSAVAAVFAVGVCLFLVTGEPAVAKPKPKPKLSVVKAPAVSVSPIDVNRFAYTDRVSVGCRGKATPLTVGWSSPGGTIGSAYPETVGAETLLALTMVAPAQKGKFKAFASCLNRNLFTKLVQGPAAGDGVSRVSCSKRQLAIGMPVRNAPYYSKNVFSRPVGSRGWETNEGTYASAVVLCVPKSSMRAVKLVKQDVPFPAGSVSAGVSARCPGGRVPISWGFESDHMPGNLAWGASLKVEAPLISQSQRQGAAGWSLTFFTPDGKPAVTQGRVAIHLTCAKPS